LRLGILKEAAPGETRVALLPDSVKALVAQGLEVYVEQGAGLLAGVADEAYAVAGATLTSDRTALLGSADLLPVVNAPDENKPAAPEIRRGCGGFLRPLDDPAVLLPAIERGVTLSRWSLSRAFRVRRRWMLCLRWLPLRGTKQPFWPRVSLPSFFLC